MGRIAGCTEKVRIKIQFVYSAGHFSFTAHNGEHRHAVSLISYTTLTLRLKNAFVSLSSVRGAPDALTELVCYESNSLVLVGNTEE